MTKEEVEIVDDWIDDVIKNMKDKELKVQGLDIEEIKSIISAEESEVKPMKLIIDIPEERFNKVREKEDIDIITLNSFIRAIENGTPYDSVIEDIKAEIIHSIAKQYSEHHQVVPVWLSIGDIDI